MKNINKLQEIINSQKNIKFFLIDGITGSGKTTFAKSLKDTYIDNKKAIIINKDIFLKPRAKRIQITKKNLKNKNQNQNKLHYDFKKYKEFIELIRYQNKRKIVFQNLYNRKNGKNDLNFSFKFDKKKIYIIEGIYVARDFDFLTNKISIILFTNIYNSLIIKIKRIRDKKISIYDVINEYMKIHLYSFLKYLKKKKFNYILNKDKRIQKYNKSQAKKLIKEINLFIKKHD
jgi:uridine kinase